MNIKKPAAIAVCLLLCSCSAGESGGAEVQTGTSAETESIHAQDNYEIMPFYSGETGYAAGVEVQADTAAETESTQTEDYYKIMPYYSSHGGYTTDEGFVINENSTDSSGSGGNTFAAVPMEDMTE